MANNNINLQNAKDLKKSFAERLHNARLMRGLSMQQLCDMMGNIITKQTLSKYENGVMLPKSDIVIALCDALEINLDYLLSYKSSTPKNIRYGKLKGLNKKEEMALLIGDYMDVLIILLAVSIHYSLIIAMKKRYRQK